MEEGYPVRLVLETDEVSQEVSLWFKKVDMPPAKCLRKRAAARDATWPVPETSRAVDMEMAKELKKAFPPPISPHSVKDSHCTGAGASGDSSTTACRRELSTCHLKRRSKIVLATYRTGYGLYVSVCLLIAPLGKL